MIIWPSIALARSCARHVRWHVCVCVYRALKRIRYNLVSIASEVRSGRRDARQKRPRPFSVKRTRETLMLEFFRSADCYDCEPQCALPPPPTPPPHPKGLVCVGCYGCWANTSFAETCKVYYCINVTKCVAAGQWNVNNSIFIGQKCAISLFYKP